MTLSIADIETLAANAARGAGAPPGQAAQFGAASAAHLGAGRDVADLGAALGALPQGPIVALPLTITHIAQGARDGLATGVIAPEDISLAASYAAALPHLAWLSADGVLAMDLTKPARQLPDQRIDLPAEILSEWSALAARGAVLGDTDQAKGGLG